MVRRRGWGGSPPNDDTEASRRIVAAAIDLIGRTGLDVSVADVADSLGIIRQTVYRYFPSADALRQAAAVALIDVFLDRLAQQAKGIADPVDAMIEAVVYALAEALRTPQLGILLSTPWSSVRAEFLSLREVRTYGMTMIKRFDVDWEHFGYDDESLCELVEFVLRTVHSLYISPGSRPRSDDELRRYLRRWLGPAIIAQVKSHAEAGPILTI
ncbi:TetR/AcrR family transcriptional regulator [Nocardia sp. NPDC004123]